MPTLIVTTREGDTRAVESPGGVSVMKLIRNEGFDELLALCGGCCSCATCHVFVHHDDLHRLPAMSQDEDELLSTSDYRRETSRLSCQLPFDAALDQLRVTIAPED